MTTLQLNALNDFMLNGTAEISLFLISTVILLCCGKFLSEKKQFYAYIWKIGVPIYVYILINFAIFQGGEFKQLTAINAYVLTLLVVLFFMIVVPFLEKYSYDDIKKNFVDIFPLYILGFATVIFLLNKVLPNSVLKLSVFTNLLFFAVLLTFSIWTTLQMRGLRIDILNISTIWKTYLKDNDIPNTKDEGENNEGDNSEGDNDKGDNSEGDNDKGENDEGDEGENDEEENSEGENAEEDV